MSKDVWSGQGIDELCPGEEKRRELLNQGPDSIEEKKPVERVSKSYNKEFKQIKEVHILLFKLEFQEDFQENCSPIESGP